MFVGIHCDPEIVFDAFAHCADGKEASLKWGDRRRLKKWMAQGMQSGQFHSPPRGAWSADELRTLEVFRLLPAVLGALALPEAPAEKRTEISNQVRQACRDLLELANAIGDLAVEAMAYGALAETWRAEGDLLAAADCYKRSVAITRRLATSAPDRFSSDLASTLHLYAHLRQEAGYESEAAGIYEEVRAILDRVVERDPSDPLGVTPMLHSCLQNLGNTYSATGNARSAAAVHQRLVIERRKLAEDGSREQCQELANSLESLGNDLRALGILGDASDAYREAMHVYESMSERNIDFDREGYARLLGNLSNACHDLGDDNAAFINGQQSLDEYVELNQRTRGRFSVQVAEAASRLATVVSESGDVSFGERLFDQAIDAWRKVPSEQQTPAAAMSYSRTQLNYANLLEAIGRAEQAYGYYEDATNIRRALVDEDRQQFAPALSNILYHFGLAHLCAGHSDKAADLFRDAVTALPEFDDVSDDVLATRVRILRKLGAIESRVDSDEGVERLFEALRLQQSRRRDDGQTLACLTELITALHDRGAFRQAVPFVVQALGQFSEGEPTSEEDLDYAGAILAEIARSAYVHGAVADVISAVEDLVSLVEKGGPNRSPSLQSGFANAGQILVELGVGEGRTDLVARGVVLIEKSLDVFHQQRLERWHTESRSRMMSGASPVYDLLIDGLATLATNGDVGEEGNEASDPKQLVSASESGRSRSLTDLLGDEFPQAATAVPSDLLTRFRATRSELRRCSGRAFDLR